MSAFFGASYLSGSWLAGQSVWSVYESHTFAYNSYRQSANRTIDNCVTFFSSDVFSSANVS